MPKDASTLAAAPLEPCQLGPLRRQTERACARANVAGLSVVIAWPSSAGTRHAILDLSQAGMRIKDLDLPVGETFEFALDGPRFACAGWGRIVHRTDDSAGVAVERWISGEDDVAAAVMGQLLAEASWSEQYTSDWA